MVNYGNSRIYKIISQHTSKCYIGSTTMPLSKRLANHVWYSKEGKNMTSSLIIKLGDYKIVLLEDFPCANKEQLLAREQFYIDKIDCVNKNSAFTGLSLKEYKQQYQKQYQKTKVICECGVESNICHISRHQKTKKHCDLLFQQEAARFRSINVSNKFVKFKTIQQLNKNDLFVD